MPTSAAEAPRVGTVAPFSAADGTPLAARLAGPEDAPPIVLVHGFSQGSLAFSRQLTGPLSQRFRLIAPDLRGHGMSAAGDRLEALEEGTTWGSDLRAAVDAFAGGKAPVVVGWSYGGRVISEYLRLRGAHAGLVFVSAVTQSTLPDGSSPLGPGAAPIAAMLEDDDAPAFHALTRFVDACTHRPVDAATRDSLIAMNAAVSPKVRRAMLRLKSDNAAVLSRVTAPTLVVHGDRDTIVRPASGRHIAEQVPGADLRVMADVGHAPFMEAADDFDHALAALAAVSTAS